MFIQTRNFQIAKIASQANDNMEGTIVTDRLLTLSREEGLDVRSFGEWVKPTESKTKYKVGEKSYSSNEIVELIGTIQYPYELPVCNGCHSVSSDMLKAAITGEPCAVRAYTEISSDTLDIADRLNVQNQNIAKLSGGDEYDKVLRQYELGIITASEIRTVTKQTVHAININLARIKAEKIFGLTKDQAMSVRIKGNKETGLRTCQAIVGDKKLSREEVIAELTADLNVKVAPNLTTAQLLASRNQHSNTVLLAVYDGIANKSQADFENAMNAVENAMTDAYLKIKELEAELEVE